MVTILNEGSISTMVSGRVVNSRCYCRTAIGGCELRSLTVRISGIDSKAELTSVLPILNTVPSN